MRSFLLRAGMVEPGPTILRTTKDPLDLHALMQSLVTPEVTAVYVITGTIGLQDTRGADLSACSEDEMRSTANEIRNRWPVVAGVGIVQRLGIREPGVQVLMIACSSTQPHEGLWDAAQFGMDRLGPDLHVDRSLPGSSRNERNVEDGEGR